MLMAIFIFVMVDVFMFIETNRLVQASMNSINGSCVTYDGSQSYYPSLQSVYGATLLSGTTASLAYVHDGNIDDIMEGNVGTTYLFVNYTGVATFDKLDFAGQVTGNTTPFTIDLYDNTTGWVSIYSFSYPGDFQIPITINGSRFIDNGTVEARVASATTGQVTDHLQVPRVFTRTPGNDVPA